MQSQTEHVDARYIMIILWLLLLTTTVQCHRVVESSEDLDQPTINVTTLFPVSNINIFNNSFARNKSDQHMKEKNDNKYESEPQDLKEKGDATATTFMNIQDIKEKNVDGDETKNQHLEERTAFISESNNQPDKGKYIAKDVIKNEYLEQKEALKDEHVKSKDNVNGNSPQLKESSVYKNENNDQRNEVPSIIEEQNVKLNSKGTTKIHATTWKLETAFAESNSDEKERNCNLMYGNEKDVEPETYISNESNKEFKPSQPLGSFFDDEVSISHTYESFNPIIQRPTAELANLPPDEYRPTFSYNPREVYETYTEFPYKFENVVNLRATNNWKPPNSLETRPTAALPFKVPAGGLYKLADPFKEEPTVYGDYGDFGLEIHGDMRENHIKKRVKPWQKLLQLMTAIIPVGIIISALTPNVITVHPGSNNPRPVNPYRRSDNSLSDIPPINERCRRRLLCELHSDINYQSQSPERRRGKQCYKIHCEDTHALQRMLHWLLTYHPGVRDQTTRDYNWH